MYRNPDRLVDDHEHATLRREQLERDDPRSGSDYYDTDDDREERKRWPTTRRP